MSALVLWRVDGVPIATARADIDAANAAAVRDELADCLGPDSDCLILDLSRTRYVDSAGLDMLFRLSERLSERRATLMLVIPESSQLNRLAAIVALPDAMAVHGTLEQARQACVQRAAAKAAEPPKAAEPARDAGEEVPRSSSSGARQGDRLSHPTD